MIELSLQQSDQVVDLFCESGSIDPIQLHGMAMPLLTTEAADYVKNTFCEVQTGATNEQNFSNECLGQQFC